MDRTSPYHSRVVMLSGGVAMCGGSVNRWAQIALDKGLQRTADASRGGREGAETLTEGNGCRAVDR